MFQMDASSFVCYLKDTLLGRPDWSDCKVLDNGQVEKPGLLVRLDLRMRDYEKDIDSQGAGRSAIVYFVMCGNVNTFAWHTMSTGWEAPKYEEFKNVSNHDSCWRTDGVQSYLNRLYFKWAEEISPRKAPAKLSSDCCTVFTRHELVTVTIKSYKDPKFYGSRYRLISVEPRK